MQKSFFHTCLTSILVDHAINIPPFLPIGLFICHLSSKYNFFIVFSTKVVAYFVSHKIITSERWSFTDSFSCAIVDVPSSSLKFQDKSFIYPLGANSGWLSPPLDCLGLTEFFDTYYFYCNFHPLLFPLSLILPPHSLLARTFKVFFAIFF